MSDSFALAKLDELEKISKVYRDTQWLDLTCHGYILSHAIFINVDFQHVSFVGVNFNDALFIHCSFDQVQFIYCHLENTKFQDCSFNKLRSLSSSFERALFESPFDDRTHSKRLLYARGYLYEIYHWCSTESKASHEEATSQAPLILLHGMTGHALDFEPLIQYTQRTVYAIHLIGHGETGYQSLRTIAEGFSDDEHQDESDSELDSEQDDEQIHEEKREAPSYDEVVEQVYSVIEQLSELDRFEQFYLLGYSMGARLALHLTARSNWCSVDGQSNCRRLKKLFIISASLGIEDETERQLRVEADRIWSDSLWEKQDTCAFLTLWNQQPLLKQSLDSEPELASKRFIHRSQHQARGLAIAFDSLGQGVMPPLKDIVSHLDCEVKWYSGQHDQKYVAIAHEAARLNSKISPFFISGLGHAPHLESPSRMSALLKDEFED